TNSTSSQMTVATPPTPPASRPCATTGLPSLASSYYPARRAIPARIIMTVRNNKTASLAILRQAGQLPRRPRPMNKVWICGGNTAELPELSNAHMRELLKRVREGDQEARAELIQGNLRLVLSVIQRFTNRGENVDDLFQVGCIGLIKAIDNFDLSQNVKFSTYAVPMIIGEIRRYLRDNNPIRVSRSLRDVAYKALQVRDSLTSRYNAEPTLSQIAEEMGLSREEVVYALDAIQEPISLFEPIYHDGGDPIFVMDQISDERSED